MRMHYGRCTRDNVKLGFCLPASECKTLDVRNQTTSDVSCYNSFDEVLVCCPRRLPDLPTPNGQRKCGIHMDPRIFGGQVTNIYEFPWMALLFYKNENDQVAAHCGGALITERWVVTAAHCVHNRLKQLVFVRLGEWDLSTNPDVERWPHGRKFTAAPHSDIQIEKAILHPKYKPPRNYYSDISLILLKYSVVFGATIKPICLPQVKGTYVNNLGMDIAGWGLTNNMTRNLSNIKHKAQIRTLPAQDCEDVYALPIKLPEQLFCAGSSTSNSCKGDSGGPFMYIVGRAYYLAGIISHGLNGCSRAAPMLGVNIFHFLEWITEQIARDLIETI